MVGLEAGRSRKVSPSTELGGRGGEIHAMRQVRHRELPGDSSQAANRRLRRRKPNLIGDFSIVGGEQNLVAIKA